MLQLPLSDIEVRILGALAEKAVTTPDNYPLSASALQAACNQATNREPVMQLGEEVMMEGVVSLRRRGLVRAIQPIGSRVTRYQHLLEDSLELTPPQLAVLGVLMLRGEQTVGELHARTARLASFADAAAVEEVLDALAARSPQPLAVRLPRRPGQKEPRYAQLLGGAPSESTPDAVEQEVAVPPVAADRLTRLEAEVQGLREEVAALRAELARTRLPGA